MMSRLLSMLAGAIAVLAATGVVLLALELRADEPSSDTTPNGEVALPASAEATEETDRAQEATAANGAEIEPATNPPDPTDGSASDDSAFDDSASRGTTEAPRPPGADDVKDQLLRGGVTAITLTLTDPTGVSSAIGSAELRFDTATGEVCFQLMASGISSPYEASINRAVGGVDGPPIVDFGPQAPTAIGCVDNDPADTAAILEDPTGHYLSLTDPHLDVDLRSQLAARVVADSALGFDSDGGGATFRLERGTVTLVGVVPDQGTANGMAALFAGTSDLTVRDELRIVPGAPAPSGRLLLADDVLFQPGSSDLDSPEDSVLVDLTAILVSRPTWRAVIVGHTDATGEEDFNLALSRARADAVLDYLVAAGVPATALSIEAAGSSRPLADNDTPDGRALNRRIELVIS